MLLEGDFISSLSDLEVENAGFDYTDDVILPHRGCQGKLSNHIQLFSSVFCSPRLPDSFQTLSQSSMSRPFGHTREAVSDDLSPISALEPPACFMVDIDNSIRLPTRSNGI